MRVVTFGEFKWPKLGPVKVPDWEPMQFQEWHSIRRKLAQDLWEHETKVTRVYYVNDGWQIRVHTIPFGERFGIDEAYGWTFLGVTLWQHDGQVNPDVEAVPTAVLRVYLRVFGRILAWTEGREEYPDKDWQPDLTD